MKSAREQGKPAAHRPMNVDHSSALQQTINQPHTKPSKATEHHPHPHPPQTVGKKH